MNTILFTDVSASLGFGKYGGTYKIATEIRNHGYSCQVVDCFYWMGLTRLKTLVDKFVTNETLLIGFSCTLLDTVQKGIIKQFWGISNKDFNNLLIYIKLKNPKIKFVAGGANIDIFFDYPLIDYAITNKADLAIIKLIDHIDNGSELKFSQHRHTRVINGNDYFYSQDMFRTSTIVWQSNDIIMPDEHVPFEVARGCIFSCGFCRYDLIGKRIGDWTKDSETIYREMLSNYEKFGITNYMFTDELINESVSKLEMLYNATSRLPFKIRYSAYARIDLIHRFPEMRDLIAATGADSISFGIETLNHEAGKKIGKGLHPDKVIETLNFCRETWKNNIVMSSGFIVGLPGESEQSVRATAEFLASDQGPLDLYYFNALYMNTNEHSAKSKFEKDPLKFGYQIESDTQKWNKDTMNSDTAYKIAKDIMSNRQKMLVSSATYLGRIYSLGYTKEQVFRMIADVEYAKSANLSLASDAKKQEYYERLLAL